MAIPFLHLLRRESFCQDVRINDYLVPEVGGLVKACYLLRVPKGFNSFRKGFLHVFQDDDRRHFVLTNNNKEVKKPNLFKNVRL